MSRSWVLVMSLTVASPVGAESLRVLALESPSFFYQEDGRYTGIEYDILEYFAKSRNATLQIELVDDFASILDRVERGEADLGAGTITITPERSRKLDFSESYFPVQVTLVERLTDDIRSLDDLAGAKVGAFANTTAEDAIKGVSRIQIVHEGGMEGMMEGVTKGELRALAADSSAIIPLLDDYPALKLGMPLGEQQGFGFAFPKGSPLTAPLSEHIKKLKASGIYFRLVTAHMGPRASEIVRAAKAP